MARTVAKVQSGAKKTSMQRPTQPQRAEPANPVSKVGAGPAPKQKFVVNHLREEDFKTGLRAYAQYRDLGISEGTSGMVQAHVIRLVPPCNPAEVSKQHYHDVEFQMIYVLKGWIKTDFEGQGVITMRQGTCWTQPPRIKHTVLDYSDDCELLEIITPAEFDTVEL